MSNTKRNHFVPQGHLKMFFQNNTIYRYDKNNNVFRDFFDTKDICIDNNLYTLETKITNKDIQYFKSLVNINFEDIDNTILNLIVRILNDDFLETITDAKPLQEKNYFDKLVDDILKPDNILRNQEDLCCIHENHFFNVRNKIIKDKSINCLYPISEKFENPKYYFYLKIQRFYKYLLKNKLIRYFRTVFDENLYNKFKQMLYIKKSENIQIPYFDLLFYTIFQIFRGRSIFNYFKNNNRIKEIDERYNISHQNILSLILQYQSIICMVKCYNEKLKPILLKNNTDLFFITADRPAINLYGKLFEDIKYIDGVFELYFPLSKDIAILWSDRDCYTNINELNINNTEDIKQYNKQIFDNADNYIFSSDKTAILYNM